MEACTYAPNRFYFTHGLSRRQARPPYPPAEYRLLADLAPGKIVTYTYLSLDVLGSTTEAKQELAVLVKRLKQKLGVKIEMVKGVGYVMRS